MKLLFLLLVNLLYVICEEKTKKETDKHIIFSVCEYYDNLGNTAKRDQCVTCFTDAYGSEEIPKSDKLKVCLNGLPERFKKLADEKDPIAATKTEILKWRQEQRVIFHENYRDVLSFKEIEVMTQILSSFFMAHSMVQDMPSKQLQMVLDPVYQCFKPGLDLSQFDNEIMNEQDVENEIKNDEKKMLAKGKNIVKRQTSEDDVSIRTRVKNMYKRVYRYFVCSINKIGENKDARSIVKDYVFNDYEGIVPAKVARDVCKW